MNDKKERMSLGRGLSSLLGDLPAASPAQSPDRRLHTVQAPVEKLKPNPRQPRRAFDPDDLAELASSVGNSGIIQPLIVRPDPEVADGYIIVAGERRWRAAQQAQIHQVPVIVRDLTESESLEIALIENIQRADLNPMEEAQAYRQLMDTFGHTQEQLSASLGKSRSAIANHLRLLSLPEEVQEFVRRGALSTGHARALVGSEHAVALARQVLNLNLSVRQTEELVKKAAASGSQPFRRKPKDPNTRVLESALSAALGAKVSLNLAGAGDKGKIVVSFRDLGHLDELCNLLNKAGMDLRKRG